MTRPLIDFVRVSGRQTRTKFLDGSWQVSDFQMLESTIKFLPAESCGERLRRRSGRSGSGLLNDKKLDGKTTVLLNTRMKNRYSGSARH